MADIPLYCDEPTTPEFSAPATAVRALLALLRGADMTENLTILAKTGLCALTEPQVCALENYAYTWSPNAAAWRTKFEKSPKGFGENELSDEDAKTLEDAETARQLLVTAVDELRSKVRGGSAVMKASSRSTFSAAQIFAKASPSTKRRIRLTSSFSAISGATSCLSTCR